MSALINRMAAYFDRKGDNWGEWYTRCLIFFLYAFCVLGFAAGWILEHIVN